MAKTQVFENRPAILGINSLGRIGKLSLWNHVSRKYFKEIVVNLGREVGTSMDAIAQAIEKDATYGLLHRFLHGFLLGLCRLGRKLSNKRNRQTEHQSGN